MAVSHPIICYNSRGHNLLLVGDFHRNSAMASKERRVVPDLSSSIKVSNFAREISVEEAIKWLRAEVIALRHVGYVRCADVAGVHLERLGR